MTPGLRAFRSVTRPNLSSAGLHAPKRIWAFCDHLWMIKDDDHVFYYGECLMMIKLNNEVGWYGIAWVCPLWVVYSWNVIQVQLELSRNFCIPIWRLWILICIVAVVDFFLFFVFSCIFNLSAPQKNGYYFGLQSFSTTKGCLLLLIIS